MINSKKKGFTIVELVIVVAVIAILAAVLIPTFSNLVKKANESADIQAVKQMNTILLAADATDGDLTLEEAIDALEEAGINGDDYVPLYNGRFFFYDSDLKQIVYTEYKNGNYEVIFPKNVNSLGLKTLSLSGTIAEKEYSTPTISQGTNGKEVATFKVSSGEEVAKLAKDFKDLIAGKEVAGLKEFETSLCSGSDTIKGVNNKEIVIDLQSDIDFKGASFNLNLNDCVFILSGNGHTISNISNDSGFALSSSNSENKPSQYGGAFLGYVSNSTIKFDNVTFKNCYFGNENVKGSAVFVGQTNKNTTVTFKNTNVINCQVSGLKGVAVYVGHSCHGQVIKFEEKNIVSNCDLIATATGKDAGLIGTIIGRSSNAGDYSKSVEGIAPVVDVTMKDAEKDIIDPANRSIITVTEEVKSTDVIKYEGTKVNFGKLN